MNKIEQLTQIGLTSKEYPYYDCLAISISTNGYKQVTQIGLCWSERII